MRALIVVAALAAALAVMWYRWPRHATAEAPLPAMNYVATAHQLGVVGYRDPAGAISPDGTRLAYTEGRFVRVVPVGGGAPRTLPPGDGQVRAIAWIGTDRLLGEESGSATRWWTFDLNAGTRSPWLAGVTIGDGVRAGDLRQVAVSHDAESIAALVFAKDGLDLWRFAADGSQAQRQRLEGRASFPAWTAAGEIACVATADGRSRLSIPCGSPVRALATDHEVVGPLAFAPQGTTVYYAAPNDRGMVELWSADLASGRNHRVSSFGRDAYAPSIATDGTIVFKVQSYRTNLADVPASGGDTRQLTTFQSETPSYHPRAPQLAFTYGTWRRVVDDAKYPDIAQEIGTIDLSRPIPARAPSEVIAKSDSEDQAMAWSPNGKWIAFHTHREMSDDVWLRPADGRSPDRRITFLGRGAEVGWPRWSPDGRSILVEGARKGDGKSVAYVIGVDQNTGAVSSDLREVRAPGFDHEVGHAEWMPDGKTIVAVAKAAPGKHVIAMLPLDGTSAARTLIEVATEHDFSGLAVAPDGSAVAYAAPAADGHFQIFRLATTTGATPMQVTYDPSHKTQPAWSPDGSRIAFTVWSYEAGFWSVR